MFVFMTIVEKGQHLAPCTIPLFSDALGSCRILSPQILVTIHEVNKTIYYFVNFAQN